MRERVLAFLGMPFSWAAAWGVAILLGVFGSIYASPLKKLTSYTQFPSDVFVYFYWVGLVVLVLVVAVQKWHEQQELRSSISRVHELVRTLPTPEFSFKLSANFYDAMAGTFALESDPDVDASKLAEQIRLVLDAINGLAVSFDEEVGGDQRYATNLTIHFPCSDLDHAARADLVADAELLFWPETTLDNCSGVLLLDPEWTTDNTNPEDASPDPHFANRIAFPIHKDDPEKPDTIRRILPGAPLACRKLEVIAVKDTPTFIKECGDRKRFDLLGETITKIKEYFEDGDGKRIGSFVSLPVVYTVYEEDKSPVKKCIGVVNIDRTEPGILRQEYMDAKSPPRVQPSQHFYRVINPYLALLARLAIKIRELEIGQKPFK